MRSKSYTRVVDLIWSVIQTRGSAVVGKDLRSNMVDRRLRVRWKPNLIGTPKKAIVKK